MKVEARVRGEWITLTEDSVEMSTNYDPDNEALNVVIDATPDALKKDDAPQSVGVNVEKDRVVYIIPTEHLPAVRTSESEGTE